MHITDFGINQWDAHLTIGGNLSAAKNRLFARDSGVVGIAVPMPTDEIMKSMSDSQLRAHISKVVGKRIRNAMDNEGTTSFEIQIIQNIDNIGYVKKERQNLVDRFGGIAYSAIGDVRTTLEQNNINVSARSFTLSNGTKVLAASVGSIIQNGKVYLDGADLFNGRALVEQTGKLIQVLGANKVRLFATRSDLPAPPHLSIANFDTLVDLKDHFPGVGTYLLTPLKPHLDLRENHMGPLRPNEEFSVQEYIGEGYMVSLGSEPFKASEFVKVPVQSGQGVVRFHSKLDESSPKNVRRTVSGRLDALIRVDTRSAENLLASVTAYASVLKVGEISVNKLNELASHENPELHAQALKLIPFFRDTPLVKREKILVKGAKFLKSAFGVVDGLKKDMEAHKHGRYTFIASHTLESIGTFGLDLTKFVNIEDILPEKSSVKNVLGSLSAIRELTTGIAKHHGNGQLNVDIVNHYLNGAKGLLETELSRRGKLKGSFALLDGFQELGTAVYKSDRGDVMGVDLTTEYFDAVNNIAFTGLGIVACKQNHACTVAIQNFGTTMAKVLRSSSEQLFIDMELVRNGNGKKIVEQYMTLQTSRAARGLELLSITEVYSIELLKKNGVSDTQIKILEDAAVFANATHTTKMSTAMSTGQSTENKQVGELIPFGSDNGRGGVNLDPGMPIILEKDLSELTRSVLKRSP
ncbi:hypothetical protein N8198_06430 [Gammaproteobacteria bacterium]|nr:hypothetical protein [Gammaproteobacteria bacterium]